MRSASRFSSSMVRSGSRARLRRGAVLLAMVLAVGCGGYAGPPDIEVAREGIRPEYHIVLQGEDGKNVLELLREHTDQLVVNETSEGVLVTGINGIEGGVEGRYWLYYVNEEAGLVAADRMSTVEGDTIEWLFAR